MYLLRCLHNTLREALGEERRKRSPTLAGPRRSTRRGGNALCVLTSSNPSLRTADGNGRRRKSIRSSVESRCIWPRVSLIGNQVSKGVGFLICNVYYLALGDGEGGGNSRGHKGKKVMTLVTDRLDDRLGAARGQGKGRKKEGLRWRPPPPPLAVVLCRFTLERGKKEGNSCGAFLSFLIIGPRRSGRKESISRSYHFTHLCI